LKTHQFVIRIPLVILGVQWLVASAVAQFEYTTNVDGSISITGYTGTNPVVNIPSNITSRIVTTLANQALYNAIITSVTLPGTMTNIGQEGFANSSLTNLVFSDGVTSIGEEAFEFCPALTSVGIPSSLTNIGSAAFAYCGFYDFTIGSGVNTLGTSALQGCEHLTNLIVLGALTNVGQDVFMYAPLRTLFFASNAPTDSLTSFEGSDINGSSVAIYYLAGGKGWSNTLEGNPSYLWNPVIQTNGGSFGVKSNFFGFNITSTTNIPIVVEASTNLSDGWGIVYSGALSNGSMHFSDAEWRNYPERFYRIRSP
jgi:hypothetical protein